MIDSVALRAAVPRDAARMAGIDARVNPSAWSIEGFEEGLSHAAGLVAATTDCAFAGFVLFSQVVDDAEILSIAVDPAMQRRGIGRHLLLAALDAARRDGATNCFLEVRASNLSAQRLYRQCGFLETGRRRDYYRSAAGREDALLFTCRLD